MGTTSLGGGRKLGASRNNAFSGRHGACTDTLKIGVEELGGECPVDANTELLRLPQSLSYPVGATEFDSMAVEPLPSACETPGGGVPLSVVDRSEPSLPTGKGPPGRWRWP